MDCGSGNFNTGSLWPVRYILISLVEVSSISLFLPFVMENNLKKSV